MNSKNLIKPKGNETHLQESGESKFDKYLTEMKELPPVTSDEQKQPTEEETKVTDVGDRTKDAGSKVTLQNSTHDNPEVRDLDEESRGRKLPITSKDLILGAVNIISIILLVIILIRFPGRSEELKKLRVQNIRDNSNINLEFSDVEVNKPKAAEVEEFFLDESGVVDFINDIENQEVEGGANIKVTFAAQSAVKDRTGNFGVPVVIELIGSWEGIDANLQKIDGLQYLFRPVRVEISYSLEDPSVVVFKYGVFLYVRESLGQTR